jgi:hypothetical protein
MEPNKTIFLVIHLEESDANTLKEHLSQYVLCV